MDIYKNTLNKLFYKIDDGKVVCSRDVDKKWSISNFDIDGFNFAIKSGRMVLEIPANFSLENE